MRSTQVSRPMCFEGSKVRILYFNEVLQFDVSYTIDNDRFYEIFRLFFQQRCKTSLRTASGLVFSMFLQESYSRTLQWGGDHSDLPPLPACTHSTAMLYVHKPCVGKISVSMPRHASQAWGWTPLFPPGIRVRAFKASGHRQHRGVTKNHPHLRDVAGAYRLSCLERGRDFHSSRAEDSCALGVMEKAATATSSCFEK